MRLFSTAAAATIVVAAAVLAPMVPAPAAAAILPTFRFSQLPRIAVFAVLPPMVPPPMASGIIAGARRNAGLPLVALGASDLGLRRLLQTPLPQLRGSAGLRLAGPHGFPDVPMVFDQWKNAVDQKPWFLP